MKSINWSQINWGSVVVNVIYVWVLGLGFAFLGRVLRFDESRDFVPLLTLVVALATVWVSYRVATRAGQQPLVHGLLVGLLVGMLGLVLNVLTVTIGVVEIAGFLMQVLAGAMGGRMAQRRLNGV
jgi:putative membrane protein (TIGR04086 family)